MPRALGRDRLGVEAGGRLLLDCDVSKGWHARRPATATSAEHPGTALRWEGDFFEVLEVRPHGGGAVRYVLARWDERHAMRVVEAYDPDAESVRERARADTARREDGHVFLLILAPLVGSFPAHVQERLERDFNVPARRLSLASALPLWVAGWLSLILLMSSAIAGPGSLPIPVLVFGVYLLAESTARLVACVLQGRAIGTLGGTLLYEAWRHLGRAKGPAEGRPVPKEKAGVRDAEPDGEQGVLDRYHLLEPAAGLLPLDDQIRLAERFGFDGLRWGRIGAIFLLVMFGPLAVTSILGAIVVFQPADLPRLAVFGGVAIEQIARLRKLASGHLAPSVLGFFVRPFARPLLA